MTYWYRGIFDKEYREVSLEELMKLWKENICEVCNLTQIENNAMYFQEEDWMY